VTFSSYSVSCSNSCILRQPEQSKLVVIPIYWVGSPNVGSRIGRTASSESPLTFLGVIANQAWCTPPGLDSSHRRPPLCKIHSRYGSSSRGNCRNSSHFRGRRPAHTRTTHPPRPASRHSHKPGPARSNRNGDNWCLYHTRFGAATRKCDTGC
jgi:hypothetical protein